MKPASLGLVSFIGGAAMAAALIYGISAFSPSDGDDAAADSNSAAQTSAEDGVVALDKAAIAHAGIRFIQLTSARAALQRNGFARALDTSTLAAIDSEITSARAALTASQADYARQRTLASEDQSAATRAVEAARAQAVADQARLTAAEHRVGLEYGPGLANLSDAALNQLVRAIAAGEASLVRIDFTDGPAARGAQVRIGEGHSSATVTLLGASASTDAKLQTAGNLAIVRGPLARSLGAGRVIPALMAATTGSEAGVLVPRDAILRYQGGLWIYRVVPNGFRRAELLDARPEANGWFVPTGLTSGEKVAAGGIGVLLSIERGGTVAEDE